MLSSLYVVRECALSLIYCFFFFSGLVARSGSEVDDGIPEFTNSADDQKDETKAKGETSFISISI